MYTRTVEENYQAVKKCVLADYPYPVEWDDNELYPLFREVFNDVLEQHSKIDNRYYSRDGKGLLMLEYLDHYVILTYRLANVMWKSGKSEWADVFYYSMRMRGCLDLFYQCEIGPYLMPVHALGACLDAHAKYGKLFSFQNGVHIGPYDIVGKAPEDWVHPVFGDGVLLESGAQVYGNCHVGNNVIVSINTVIINEDIPDNCVVCGQSPHLVVKRLKVRNDSILRD